MKSNLIKKILFWTIAIVCIATLWKFQDTISVNIPWWDDFYGILVPIQKLFSNAPFGEKFHYIFSFNNEHRVVNDRLFMLIVYILNGFSFNLKALAMLGYVNLILIFLLIYKVSRPYIANILFFIPIIFIIFQAQYFESLQSLMVPFQNFSVILYVLLCFYFLIFNNNDRFFWALSFAVLALYTHGNGILAILIGLIILLFQQKYKKALVWSGIGLLFILLYFVNYTKPNWSSSNSFINHPIESFMFIFEFLGAYSLNIIYLSSAATESSLKHSIPTIFGILLSLLFLFIVLNKYRIFTSFRKEYFNKLRHSKIDLFLIACVLFFIATGILISISRTGFPIFSRYTINSSFYMVFIYILILINFRENRILTFLFSLFTFFILLISYYNNYGEAIFRKRNLITDGINWRKTGTWMNNYDNPVHISNLNPLLTDSYNENSYVFPNTVLFNAENIKPSESDTISKITLENNLLKLIGINTIDNLLSKENGLYIVLKSNEKSFIFPIRYSTNNIINYLKGQKYLRSNYQTFYSIKNLPKGVYSIYKIEVKQGIPRKFNLPFQLNYTKNAEIVRHF